MASPFSFPKDRLVTAQDVQSLNDEIYRSFEGTYPQNSASTLEFIRSGGLQNLGSEELAGPKYIPTGQGQSFGGLGQQFKEEGEENVDMPEAYQGSDVTGNIINMHSMRRNSKGYNNYSYPQSASRRNSFNKYNSYGGSYGAGRSRKNSQTQYNHWGVPQYNAGSNAYGWGNSQGTMASQYHHYPTTTAAGYHAPASQYHHYPTTGYGYTGRHQASTYGIGSQYHQYPTTGYHGATSQYHRYPTTTTAGYNTKRSKRNSSTDLSGTDITRDMMGGNYYGARNGWDY